MRFNPARLKAIQAGERIELPVPQLTDPVAVEVKSNDTLASGNVSIKGHVNDNRIYSFILTLGESSMFATLGTPNGIFNIRGNSEHAWVIPAKALEGHVDPDVADFRVSEAQEIPREPEQQPTPAGG
ncbi:MAG: hypothetical protein U5K56_02340 [Halioglobus sp.]|nr:hypothetical protein [Halioglobus sp.]